MELLQKECGMEAAMMVEEGSGEIEKFWVDCVLLKSEVGYEMIMIMIMVMVMTMVMVMVMVIYRFCADLSNIQRISPSSRLPFSLVIIPTLPKYNSSI